MAGMHPRNVQGMLQNRKNLHMDAIRRTDAALEALESSGSAITFQLVARARTRFAGMALQATRRP